MEFSNYKCLRWLLILFFFTLQSTECLPSDILKNQINELRGIINTLKAENNNLKHRLTETERATQQLTTDVEDIKTSSGHLTNVGSSQDQHITRNVHVITKRALYRRRRRFKEVGFHAELTKDVEYPLHKPIQFNKVVMHIGNVNAYDKNTGIFTAPTSGTYLFTVNVVAHKHYYIEASIRQNGVTKVTAVSDGRAMVDDTTAAWNQGSATGFLILKAGDKVSVELQWPNGIHSIHGAGKTSFGGYLLRRH